jgi:hypothetical protein
LTNHAKIGYGNPVKSKLVAYMLLFLTGLWGGHHFYLGRPGKGFLYLFTWGLCFFGWIYDFFTLEQQVDDANLRIVRGPRIVVPYEGQGASGTAGFSAEKQILVLSGRSPVLTVRDRVRILRWKKPRPHWENLPNAVSRGFESTRKAG